MRAARQQLSAFLLRQERVYPGNRTPWTKAHRGWLADQTFAQPAQQIVLAENIEAVRLGDARRLVHGDSSFSRLYTRAKRASIHPNHPPLRGSQTLPLREWVRRPTNASKCKQMRLNASKFTCVY